MENIQEKAHFLAKEYTAKLKTLQPETPQLWGKMNVQQMIEHMSDYVRIASGKSIVPSVTPEENIPKMQGFLMSEKPFRENTPNVLMSDTPIPVRHATQEASIHELQQELDYFFEAYEKEKGKKIPSPFFGELNYEMQVQLLHKHAWHHLRQFGFGG
jgi:hypothetical protein